MNVSELDFVDFSGGYNYQAVGNVMEVCQSCSAFLPCLIDAVF